MRLFTILVLASSLGLSACPGGILDSATCCECLLSHEADGTDNPVPDQSEVVPNCYPGDLTWTEENSLCSNHMAEEIVKDEGEVEVTDLACVESVCKDECEAVVQSGVTFTEASETP